MLNKQKFTDILLVDDHPIVRIGFATLLGTLGTDIAFHETDSAEHAKLLAGQYRPQVAIVDLSLCGITSLSLIQELRAAVPGMRVLVVSMHDERLYAERALRAGANGYLMKHNAAKTIVRAVQDVHGDKVWLSDEMRGVLLERMHGQPGDGVERLASLSDREMEVFRLIGMGVRKADISRQLGLSANTVETYRAQIKRKLGVSSGAELHRMAFSYCNEQVGQAL